LFLHLFSCQCFNLLFLRCNMAFFVIVLKLPMISFFRKYNQYLAQKHLLSLYYQSFHQKFSDCKFYYFHFEQ